MANTNFFNEPCLVHRIVQWLSHLLLSALVRAGLNSAVVIPITMGHPISDATQHRHWLETIVQRHLLGESQRPSGQWAHSWLQESLMALFCSKKLRRHSVASGLDQAAGEIGTKALAGTVWPKSDDLYFWPAFFSQEGPNTEAVCSLLA